MKKSLQPIYSVNTHLSAGQPKIWVYLDHAKTLHLVWQYFIPFAKFSLLNNQSGHTDWFIPFRLFV